MAPSCPSAGVPVWMGPERRGSKNSFCPRRAAASESRYLLVVSTGRSGNGERVLMVAHSCWLKPSLPESADWLRAAVATMRNDPSNTASNTPNHSADLRITPSSMYFSVPTVYYGVSLRWGLLRAWFTSGKSHPAAKLLHPYRSHTWQEKDLEKARVVCILILLSDGH